MLREERRKEEAEEEKKRKEERKWKKREREGRQQRAQREHGIGVGVAESVGVAEDWWGEGKVERVSSSACQRIHSESDPEIPLPSLPADSPSPES